MDNVALLDVLVKVKDTQYHQGQPTTDVDALIKTLLDRITTTLV